MSTYQRVKQAGLFLPAGVIVLLMIGMVGPRMDEVKPMRSATENEIINPVEQAHVRYHRYAEVQPGKSEEAMAFVREVTGYVRNRVPGYVIEVYIEQVGDKNIVHWFSDAESMVDIARVSVLLSEDETYQGYIQIGSSLFIPESNVEEVMVAID